MRWCVQTKLAERIWAGSAGTVKIAGSCKKPDDKALQELIANLNEDIVKLGDLKAKNRKDRDYWDHMAVLAESSQAVGWIVNVRSFKLSVIEIRVCSCGEVGCLTLD